MPVAVAPSGARARHSSFPRFTAPRGARLIR